MLKMILEIKNWPFLLNCAKTSSAFLVPSSLYFLSDPGVPGVRSMGPDVRHSLTDRLCADLTDATLADDDSNSIPTDDVNKAILGNVAI